MEISGNRRHASPEVARDLINLQAEEVFDLSAGDEDRDTIGEADHYRTRNEADGCAQPSNAHEDQNDSGE